MAALSPKESVDTSSRLLIESCLQNLSKQTDDSVRKISSIWCSIYGSCDVNLTNRFTNLESHFKDFWDGEIETQEEIQKTHSNNVEQMGKDAFELEKALGVDFGVFTIQGTLPLVQLEDQLSKILDKCKDVRDKRYAEYSSLQKKEEELCSILDEKPQFHFSIEVPTTEDMQRCENRLEDLGKMKEQLEYDFINFKYELGNLLNECGISPFRTVEHFACSSDETKVNFPVTKQNLKQLMSAVSDLRKKKEEMIVESNQLRTEVANLSRKMLRDQEELNDFLNDNFGFTKPTILKLKEKLTELKEERKSKLKELILSHRKVLEDLWERCCYSDEQRAEFRPYHTNCYNEEVLNFYEIEVEHLEDFYGKYKKIFQLLEKHEELWNRLLHLEELASDVNRLFSNRGGQLLQEEKERKLIQKKVPAVKAELITLLHEYKAKHGKDFLYFGIPLEYQLEQKEQDYEYSKENKKLQRKVINTQNVLLESRLGTRPATGVKRKFAPVAQDIPLAKKTKKLATIQSTLSSAASTTKSTPCSDYTKTTKVLKQTDLPNYQRRNLRSPNHTRERGPVMSYANYRTPVKIPAASAPENGSPSYESFQEHLEKSNNKDMCRSSSKHLVGRVLRPRNLNKTTEIPTPKVTPYKTPKTPMTTPSKIPFRIATGSKIPSIVPPISPRTRGKLTTPRSRLPLIF